MTHDGFWHALESLHRWERENLPGADTPQGNEVLVWLLKSKSRPRPLKDLYRSSRFSEPTVRSCLKVFVSHGFVIIESNGEDMRTRFARGTLKLEKTVNEYRHRFHEVALLAHKEGVAGSGLSLATTAVTDVAGAVSTKPP